MYMCVIGHSVIYAYMYVRMCTCNACVIVCMQIVMSFMSCTLFVCGFYFVQRSSKPVNLCAAHFICVRCQHLGTLHH